MINGLTNTYTEVEGRNIIITYPAGEPYNANDYRFLGYYENNTFVSNKINYKFRVSGNRTLEARFEAKIKYTLTWVNLNNSGQTTTSIHDKKSYTVLNTTEEIGDYLFVAWTKNGVQISTQARRSIIWSYIRKCHNSL